jgi:hypothetical protein
MATKEQQEQQRFANFTRFDLPGFNIPLNFTPPPINTPNGHGAQIYPLFRTALNEMDREEGYISYFRPLQYLMMPIDFGAVDV